jgi:ZIP family zinc transporter
MFTGSALYRVNSLEARMSQPSPEYITHSFPLEHKRSYLILAVLVLLMGGLALVLPGGLALVLPHTGFARNATIVDAFRGGMLAACATALGTLPLLLSRPFSQRTYDTMLGFGAGVMLAACAFSLVIPALAAAKSTSASSWSAASAISCGILLGGMLLLLIDKVVPHEHFFKGVEGARGRLLKRTWLFVLAIALHNLPEGLAIGVAFGGEGGAAHALATGIAIQNIPEGMVVALTLRGVGYSRAGSAAVAIVSGLVEPVAAVFGAALIGLSASLLPWGLSMAAGAMLFVISHEIIPESHRKGHESFATAGLMLGFVLMMTLDTALAQI